MLVILVAEVLFLSDDVDVNDDGFGAMLVLSTSAPLNGVAALSQAVLLNDDDDDDDEDSIFEGEETYDNKQGARQVKSAKGCARIRDTTVSTGFVFVWMTCCYICCLGLYTHITDIVSSLPLSQHSRFCVG